MNVSSKPTLAAFLASPEPRDDRASPPPSQNGTTEESQTPAHQSVLALQRAAEALALILSALFEAAGQILDALLDLVEKLAGPSASRAVDQAAAKAIESVTPPVPLPLTGGSSRAETPGTDLDTRVRDILGQFARDGERSAITDGLVSTLVRGVQFMADLERQDPGLLSRIREEAPTPRTAAEPPSPTILDAALTY